MTFSATDKRLMRRALALARKGLCTSTPNPRVGCVIADPHGQIVGAGWHRRAGEAHAEVLALAQAGERARGASAYVTLEPCSHQGRTPPCADALIEAGIGRVFFALADCNPQVAGRGIARLAAHGVQTAGGLLAQEAWRLNPGFFSRNLRQRPWVWLKLAASLDGKSALANGASQWITGAAARRDGHRLRARACAVLTGSGTILADDPQLTVRAVPCTRQPLRIIVDSALQTPPTARIFDGGAVWIAHADTASAAVQAALQARGARLLAVPAATGGGVDLAALLALLAREDINELHVEAGATLNGAFLQAGLVDEIVLYSAPCVLGEGARGLFAGSSLTALEQAPRLQLQAVRRLGADVRLQFDSAAGLALAQQVCERAAGFGKMQGFEA